MVLFCSVTFNYAREEESQIIKKKILFFLPALTAGGAERVTLNIIRKLDLNLYDIYMVFVKKTGENIEYIPSYVNVYDLNVSKTIFSIFKLRAMIKEIDPYAIYSTLNRTHIVLYLSLLTLNYSNKIVLRMPTSPKLLMEQDGMNFISKFLLDRILKSANLIIAQTPEMKDEISFYHNVNIEKIGVLINPLDTDFIDKNIKNIENPFDIDNTLINVVASGRATYAKAYDILISAFEKVYSKNNNFRLFIIGANYENEQKDYEILARELGIGNVVKFLGFQKNPYRYYYYSDLFVLSSRREGLPNVVLENLYLHKPIVATRCISFMDSLIQNGKNGFLVEVEDSVQLADAILNFKKLEGGSEFINHQYLTVGDIFERGNL